MIFFGLGSGGTQWSTALPGNDIAISGIKNQSIKSAFDISEIGFYIDKPTTSGGGNTDVCNTAVCTASSFDVEFRKRGVQVGLAAGIAPGGTLSYFGFDLGIAFDEVVITDNDRYCRQ